MIASKPASVEVALIAAEGARGRFLDTNILLYLLSGDRRKADLAEDALAAGGTLSVQVLNEFASVATRKLGLAMDEVREVLATVTAICTVTPLTLAVHQRGLEIAQRLGFSVYDAMIVAAALESGCSHLLSEDLQHGQVIDQRLTVVNPFRD